MALNIPTTADIAEQNLTKFESEISQTAPLNEKAFLRVLAAAEAMQTTSLYKYVADQMLQNLAVTATGQNLTTLGANYGVTRKPGESAVLTATLPATTGTTIPVTTPFVGDSNGVTYYPQSQVVAANNVATLTLVSIEIGVAGNLNVDETITMSTQIAGAENIATVTAIVNEGLDVETDEAYRIRVLDEIRTVGGGGNVVDYRRWAQETPGVIRAYPYAGRPDVVQGSPADQELTPEISATVDAQSSATCTITYYD
jgi:uncharacterized phage protein gp47/JayE